MSPDDDEPYADPLRALRYSDRIWLNTANGMPWATNSYWAVEMPDHTHPLARTLARYNIAFDKPATINVGTTLVVDPDGKLADIQDKVLDKVLDKVPEGIERVERHCINGAPVFLTDGTYERWLAAYDLPGGKLGLLNVDLLRLVERWTGGYEWWGGPDPMKPMVRKRDDRVIGVLMGVRHIVNGTNV